MIQIIVQNYIQIIIALIALIALMIIMKNKNKKKIYNYFILTQVGF